MIVMLIALMGATALCQEGEVVGERPYEMVWANRIEDDHPPLVDFEDLTGWTVEPENAEATFERTREQQLFGKYVGKLTYRGTGPGPKVHVLPPEPVEITEPFDAVTCWIYGNNWAWTTDRSTPRVSVTVVFEDATGAEFGIPITTVNWKEWFLCHRRLTPDQIARVQGGASFKRFEIRNGTNEERRAIYFDSLAVFLEDFPPLEFEPRPERGIPMFPGQSVGTNTGPGKLPFPTRPETILPDNLADDFTTGLAVDGDAYVFTYQGADGKLTYRIAPRTGPLGDITAQWEGRGGLIHPCVDGGVYLQGDAGPLAPEEAEHLGTQRKGDQVESRWRVGAGDMSAEVTYTYRLWGKSLVIDVVAPGGQVGEVRYGHAEGLENPRLVTNPYYTYGGSRPAVAISGPADAPLFLAGNTDWCLSNASEPWAANAIKEGRVHYQGGTRYTPKTDGKRNDCYERLFITLSPHYEEVLPNIPNPTSPWKHVTGTRLWRAHGAGNRENDANFWRKCHRYGMTQVVITDHETGWRDGGESFTFRTKTAPKKGGDKGQYDYARIMQDELGFVYGPYNNFTDFAPVNEFWSADMVNRVPDKQLQQAWARCYAPKPARAVEYCAKLAPIIESKFHFSTAYCDVHTAVTPWSRVDYDYRVPGAGTFAAVFYSYGEIMFHQKAAWDGPVYSEGNNHWLYCGLTDGNYGQDQRYGPATNPWLVDFDLRKMHDLCCNFGMGNPGMFFGREYSFGRTRKEIDASIDRFLAAAVAFGHTGFLTYDGGEHHALRSYYMLQQLHSDYALSSADEIRYADANGKLRDTSAAVASGAYKRSQVVTRYESGCITAVNGNTSERMKVEAYGRKLDLPPNGYVGWTEDGSIEVRSADPNGHRCDYADTPAHLYVDGRGRFMRFEKAAGDGIGICRILPEGKYEIIPYQGAECGFAIKASSATALDQDRKELGPAQLRYARGLCYVMPVEGAFSYILTAGETAKADLTCERDYVVAGEKLIVRGKQAHDLQIPADAKEGARIWREFEGKWIDFTVVPLAYAGLSLDGDILNVELTSNLAQADDFTVKVADQTKRTRLEPGVPDGVKLDLGKPEREASELLVVEIAAGELTGRIERGMRIVNDVWTLVSLPDKWQGGMALRGEEERFDFGTTRAYVAKDSKSCGGVRKQCLSMHPPWVGGVGYTFALYDPVTLPAKPPAAFRASVGKGDGSDLGDGILYKIEIVDEKGAGTIVAETVVAEHKWVEIEGDLTPWAGKSIQIKLISDVGVNDDSSGDWACWADMRIESLEPALTRRLDENTEEYRRVPGPFPIKGLTVADLRNAKQGWLRYDGIGLSGIGDAYGSFAVVNGVELGNMAPAGGSETGGVWAEKVGVPLTPEAIQTLGLRNEFVLRNPKQDWFKVRRFWIELELADGRKCSSQVSTAAYTQPPSWPFAEGIGVPFGEDITVEIWFDR